MANLQRNFIAGRMNKSLEERLLPNGEYTNAVNVRLGSTEQSEIGSVENSKGNTKLTELAYTNGTKLSNSARCIGSFEDSANETIYWFVHDPAFTQGVTGKLDLIVSYNVRTGGITYHIISIDNGGGVNTTLNFNPSFLITGVDKIDNLLFFTDNVNPPRVINIDRNYQNPTANTSGNQQDQFDRREILVVKQPPLQAPTFQLIQANNEDSYMTDNFICFGYRYKYANAEYSATSQFSEPAFAPKAFNFSAQSFQNEGMENRFNAAIVTYNSGSELVKGIDILYKEANDSTIKVIERISKAEAGLSDNTFYTFTFTESKIFSVLPESEILRLYDNVPTLAKAQTLMANRLVYGNYVEGFDLKDTFNQPLTLSYTTSLSQSQIGEKTLPVTTAQSSFTAFGFSTTINDSAFRINFSGFESSLVIGATIDFSFTFEHDSWSGSSLPDQTTGPTTVHFSYTLIQDFTSSATPINDLIATADFQAKFGTLTTGIQTVANAQAGAGTTLTDNFNFLLQGQLGTVAPQYDINQTGRTNSTPALPSAGEGIAASVILPATLQLQILAAQYEETGVGTNTIVEYFKITNATASISEVPNSGSLHSNRGYEVGIIYMDSFNRASTALVSTNNTVNIPCSASTTKNEILVSIPVTQRAPSWATRYKFCIKADRDTYDTIYSSIFFEDDATNNVFFLLEGDNIGKVKDGDRLIVKRDIAGPLQNCTEATALEVVNQLKDFITVTRGGAPVSVPAGVYMKMNSVSFQAKMDDDDVVDRKVDPVVAKGSNRFPILAYPFFMTDSAGTNTTYNFPIGTRVVMKIEQTRPGIFGGIGGCEERSNVIEQTIICSEAYADVEAFFAGENVGVILEQNGISNPATIQNDYIATTSTGSGLPSQAGKGSNTSADIVTVFGSTATSPKSTNYYRLYKDTTSTPANLFYLLVSGGTGCSGSSDDGNSTVRVDFTIYRRDSVIVFESEPKTALPDLWYESSQSFEIDVLGDHLGNVTNQDIGAGVAGLVRTDFSNCFAFGNGVESYKILDASYGEQFNLGNRTLTTGNTTFQKAHRFADVTYSGVFNDETNVNKLNEFNLGLANFKPLEETFGDVEILYARRDDILVLQEDKISYVLAGKDLLSDASGDGQLTSVPEVLGKQIARIENYGISNHPESFAAWGESKFFTDAKRSAVINLVGSSAANEQLQVISEAGMRSWFRDLFTASFTTQKLGAYDPYMNEYVLTSNTILKPEVAVCTACGVSRNITITAGETFIYCVDLEEQLGTVVVRYNIPIEGSQNIITEATSQDIVTETGDNITTEGGVGVVGYTITALYDGGSVSSGLVYTSGQITFNKNSTTVNQVVIEVSSNATVDDTIEITVECPSGTLLNLYSICVTDAIDAGKFIHNEASWTDGSLFSATQSNLVPFGSGTGAFVISQYNFVNGNQGVGLIPTNGSVMTIATNKINFDDFQFNATNNNYGYLRTNTTYANTETDVTTLLGLVNNIPINTAGAPNYYKGSFTVPSTGNNLYLVYDYRNPPAPTPTPPVYDYKQYQQCNDATVLTFVRGASGYSFPGFIKFDGECYENPQTTSSVSNTDIAPLPTYVDCATCLATVPTPTPTPVTYIYREYEDCEDSTTKQIFRLVDGIGVTFPEFVKYNNICYNNPATTGSTSIENVPSLQYASCSECLGTIAPTPPSPPPVPPSPPTPPTPTYYYWAVQECSGTNVIQIRTTDPDVGNTKISIEFGGVCYEVQSGGSVNTNDISAAFIDCAACAGTPPVPPTPPTPPSPPPVPPTPPTPPTQLWYRLTSCGNHGDCWLLASQAPTFDQRFVDSASNINYFYRYAGDAGQTYSQGDCSVQAVGTETGCPPAPTPPSPPPVPPTPPATTDVEIRECGTTSPTYNVTVNFSTSTTGVAFKGTGTGGGCGTTFDGSRCWEIVTLGVSVGNCNITTTQIGTCGNLTDCAPPPTPPTPPSPPPPTPPATVYARYGDCATGGNDIITEVSGPGGTIFPNVLLISGICYEYLDLGGVTGPLYSNYTSYTDCAICQSAAPTPTPPSPPTPTPGSCFAINNITRSSISANDACASTRFNTHYFDNAQFCDATLYYGTDSTCTSLYGFATYVTNGSYTRYWTGTSFQSCIGCP